MQEYYVRVMEVSGNPLSPIAHLDVSAVDAEEAMRIAVKQAADLPYCLGGKLLVRVWGQCRSRNILEAGQPLLRETIQ